jgi:hypothetical protein
MTTGSEQPRLEYSPLRQEVVERIARVPGSAYTNETRDLAREVLDLRRQRDAANWQFSPYAGGLG